MAHDGQDVTVEASVQLPDLLTLIGAAIAPVAAIFDKSRAHLRALVVSDGRISARLVEPYTSGSRCPSRFRLGP